MTTKDINAVDLLLSNLDRNQLDRFIRKECINDSRFRDRFLALGAGSVFKPSPDSYSDRIESLINDYGGRYGYVKYRDTFDFNRAVSRIIEEADEAIQNQEWDVATAVLTGVSGSCERIINCGDDSAGELGAIVNDCFETWYKLCKAELPENVKDEIFGFAIARFEAEDLKGWDWWWKWIEIAIELADTPERQSRVTRALETIKADSDDWIAKHDAEKARSYRLKIMARCGTPEQQKEFMYKNVANPEFRNKLIKMAWDGKDYEEVIRLADEGELHGADRPDLVQNWRKWKMKVYRLRNDTENILRLARYFFFCRGELGEREYSMETMYQLMKSLIPDGKWSEWAETLLNDAVDKREIVHELYICTEEKMWDKYMACLHKHPSTYLLDKAPDEVKKLYQEEFVDLYEQQVRNFFLTANNRESYRNGAVLLRNLIGYGGKEKAQAIIAEQKARIPRRPALTDELSKIQWSR